MLDLGTLEEAHAAIDAVRHAGVEQRVLEHARLGVGAVEHRDLRRRDVVCDQALHHVDDERGLVDVGRRRVRAYRLALAVHGPQVLAEPRLVVPDQRVRRVEDVAMRAVVLFELDQLHRRVGRAEIALEMLHVGDVGAPERVDGLVVVADREHRRLRPGEQPQPAVLQRVRILELVDEQVREAAAVVLAQGIVAGQQLEGPQQQLGKSTTPSRRHASSYSAKCSTWRRVNSSSAST